MAKKKQNNYLIVGIIVIFVGVMIGVIPLFVEMMKTSVDNHKVQEYIDKTSNFEKKKEESSEYLLVLEIPKISLRQGIYDFLSKENSIEYHVTIAKESTLPDRNGNLILMAHNGTSDVSYFKNLYQLKRGDQAFIYYNGVKYTYVVSSMYEIEKDGDAEIYRDKDKSTLTLITCKTSDFSKQSIIILYLSKTENY